MAREDDTKLERAARNTSLLLFGWPTWLALAVIGAIAGISYLLAS